MRGWVFAVALGIFLAPTFAGAGDDARALSQRAKVAFDAGDFTTAATLLEEAYRERPWPVLLYNLGRAYQQAGAKAQAVDAYERYLHEEPSSPDAGAVHESILRLKEQIARDRELEAQAKASKERSIREEEEANRARAVAREADERARHKPSAWPWVVAGAGVGGVAAGVVFGVLAGSAHASAQQDASAAQAQSDESTAKTYALVTNVLLAAGGTVAVVGAVWGIFDVRLASAHRVQAALSPTGLTVGGSF